MNSIRMPRYILIGEIRQQDGGFLFYYRRYKATQMKAMCK